MKFLWLNWHELQHGHCTVGEVAEWIMTGYVAAACEQLIAPGCENCASTAAEHLDAAQCSVERSGRPAQSTATDPASQGRAVL